MGLVILGAMGLAIDVSQLYGQLQMAQSAADAAALAGIMSIFDGTNTVTGNTFGSAQHVCGTTDTITPCKYAASNGFGTAATDTVTLDFPASTTAPPGVTLSSDSVNFIKVTVARQVPTTLMRFLGAANNTTIKATAWAAITLVVSPTPIVITHPSLTQALSMNGSDTITITGGPQRSIEVDSSASTAMSPGAIDLSKAGPAGTGGRFWGIRRPFRQAVYHQPRNNRTLYSTCLANSGSTRECERSCPTVCRPAPVSNGCGSSCTLYSPGFYNGGMDLNHVGTIQFKPGVYYVSGGDVHFKQVTATMCTTCTADPNTGSGMLIYHTGSGAFNIDTQASVTLLGAGVSTATPPVAPTAPYYGILFFQDRSSAATSHPLGKANSCMSLREPSISPTLTPPWLQLLLNTNR